MYNAYRHFTVDSLTPAGRYLALCQEEKSATPCVLCARPTGADQLLRNHRECTLFLSYFFRALPVFNDLRRAKTLTSVKNA